MSETVEISLIEAECRSDAKPDGRSIEDRMKAAMKRARGHWMVLNENNQFKGAVVAVMLQASDEDKEQITRSLKLLSALNAAMQGIPVDFGQMLSEDEPKGLPLVAWWHETKESA